MIFKFEKISGGNIANRTINMQWGYYPEEIKNNENLFRATLNVKINYPMILGNSKLTCGPVEWHHQCPKERFSFYPVKIEYKRKKYNGYIYVASLSPHNTNPCIYELILPEIPGIEDGNKGLLDCSKLIPNPIFSFGYDK